MPTYIFDVGARMNSHDVAVLDAEIVAYDTVHPSAAIIQIIVGQHDQNRVLSLLALDQDGITTEQL